MTLITDTNALTAFCERQAGVPFIAVDTEFMRERTYWPKLCLVQVAGPDEAVAVDALAPAIDLAPLYALFDKPDIVKVFHAARQDLEIFCHSRGKLPAPVFDTQVAAMVCSFGDQVGYETLAAKLAKARVDKASRFTDWALRPLSDRQIDYALNDVTHLREIYRKLAARLQKNGRTEWLAAEMATLTAPVTYAVEPEQAFRRIKVRSQSGQFLSVLRELAAWREREAQARDLPRGRVLRDEALLEIAHHAPVTREDLSRTRGLGRKIAESAVGDALLKAVADGLAKPKSDWPQAETRPALPRGIGPIADLLKVLLKMKCEDADVAQRLVASSADVELIAAFGDDADVPALHGWRRQVFGEEALRLRAGEVALAIHGKSLRIVPAAGMAMEDPDG